MSRQSRLALACYPPSWRERYGEELAELTGDGRGVALDLLVGAVRAWLHPAGVRTLGARRLSAISTVHVCWCAAFIGTAGYAKSAGDPPLPGLESGADGPLWLLAQVAFGGGSVLLLAGGTPLLLRLLLPATRPRDWRVLRPMLPAVGLLLLVVAEVPLVQGYGRHPGTLADTVVLLVWLALLVSLVAAGAVGPVVALRRSRLPLTRLPMLLAVGVTLAAVGLALVVTASAAVLTARADALTIAQMWVSAAILLMAATASSVSTGRALLSH